MAAKHLPQGRMNGHLDVRKYVYYGMEDYGPMVKKNVISAGKNTSTIYVVYRSRHGMVFRYSPQGKMAALCAGTCIMV